MFAGEKISWLLVCAVQNSMLTYLISKKTKHEARNSKQYQNTNFQMFQTLKRIIYNKHEGRFRILVILDSDLFRISKLEFRISGLSGVGGKGCTLKR
jgi:hypothetical protein